MNDYVQYFIDLLGLLLVLYSIQYFASMLLNALLSLIRSKSPIFLFD